ncbi:MAG: hypothetical protein HLUCCO17_00395 [Saliniramus fredricksonii]|jgi:hypothetical protein|uniref:Uncharacterized protein n=1 Tax=Saliniramus fredricksonii TaxID=1653334 RepID=A0A0N8KEX9_9HYPH|nr:hypothetical protein [Saliniramus fredricksonii]KPQ12586.1 MAG: hypothetical protein HLUCCO17_00395 [Saliniramus fredricksonii]SCC82739.1 hypothetical protein GA0071312_3749 [Saliniramus fredricksonii]
MKGHRSRHPWLLAGFVLALVLTGFFAIRLVVSTIYWSGNQDRPIEGWMPIGYIAQSWDVPRDRLAEAIQHEPGALSRKSLAHIAEERGESVETLIARIENAIADAREEAVDGDD